MYIMGAKSKFSMKKALSSYAVEFHVISAAC